MARTITTDSDSWLRLSRRICIPLGQTRRELLAQAIAAARASQSRFGRPIAFVLSRALLVLVERLPISGLTFPLLPTNLLLPLILLDKALADAALAEAQAVERAVNRAALETKQWRRIQPPAHDEQTPAAEAAATGMSDKPVSPARLLLARLLLHEAAHHCGVVWPEWRNWVNTFARRLLFFIPWRDRRFPVFPFERIYGIGVNSADTLAARILDEASAKCRAVG